MGDEARVQMIRDRLTAALSPESLDVIDESHEHVGHAGAKTGKGHFQVVIVARSFSGKNPIERHRMVYDALADAMYSDIHALSIRAYAPDEI